MNAKIPATLVALASFLAIAQESPSPQPPQPASAPAAADPKPPDPSPASAPPAPRAVVAPPIVRLPISDAIAPTPAPASTPGLSGTPAANPQLGWSTDGVGLRTPVSSVRTNRTVEMRGAIPKLIRSPRRTFGGFLTGFVHLFNPLAPVDQGVGSKPGQWYDGQDNLAPLPRAMRDERSHEASAILFSTPLIREPEAEPVPAPRASPVPTP